MIIKCHSTGLGFVASDLAISTKLKNENTANTLVLIFNTDVTGFPLFERNTNSGVHDSHLVY